MSKEGESGHVNVVVGWRRALLWFCAIGIRIWQKSLRLNFDKDAAAKIRSFPNGVLFLVWHNRLFSALEAWNMSRGIDFTLHGLVSASRDGALLATFLHDMGVVPIRGSSSRRGAPAARSLVKILRSSGDVGITVDGPRGPLYVAHPGAALLAKHTDASIVLYSTFTPRAIRFKSWDRFELPLPFSRVEVRIDILPPVSTWEGNPDREEIRKKIEDRLRKLTADPIL